MSTSNLNHYDKDIKINSILALGDEALVRNDNLRYQHQTDHIRIGSVTDHTNPFSAIEWNYNRHLFHQDTIARVQPWRGCVNSWEKSLAEEWWSMTGNCNKLVRRKLTKNVDFTEMKMRWCSLWFGRFYYKVIGNANLLIANIDNAKGLSSKGWEGKKKKKKKKKSRVKLLPIELGLISTWFKVRWSDIKWVEVSSQLGCLSYGANYWRVEIETQSKKLYTQVILISMRYRATWWCRMQKSISIKTWPKGIKARIALTQGNCLLLHLLQMRLVLEFELMSASPTLWWIQETSLIRSGFGKSASDESGYFLHPTSATCRWNFSSTQHSRNPKGYQ